jgi:hypothetical protein
MLTTKRKQTATLLPKTRRPLNVIHGSARFAKFNRAGDNSRALSRYHNAVAQLLLFKSGDVMVARSRSSNKPISSRRAFNRGSASATGIDFDQVLSDATQQSQSPYVDRARKGDRLPSFKTVLPEPALLSHCEPLASPFADPILGRIGRSAKERSPRP